MYARCTCEFAMGKFAECVRYAYFLQSLEPFFGIASTFVAGDIDFNANKNVYSKHAQSNGFSSHKLSRIYRVGEGRYRGVGVAAHNNINFYRTVAILGRPGLRNARTCEYIFIYIVSVWWYAESI